MRVVPPASKSGICKATSITMVDGDENNALLPAIVVAIRGSASTVNHMVNSNSNDERLQGFVVRYPRLSS